MRFARFTAGFLAGSAMAASTALVGGLLVTAATAVTATAASAAPATASGVCATPPAQLGYSTPGARCPSRAATLSPTGGQTPGPNPGNDITNNGPGPVMTNPVVYNVYWLPAGSHYESDGLTASDTRYENLLDRFFSDLGASDFHNIGTQYTGQNPNGTIANATTNLFANSYVDITGYGGKGSAATPLQDSDIQAAVDRAVTHFGSPRDINHIYMVYTAFGIDECHGTDPDTHASCNFPSPPGTNTNFDFCAYHGHFGNTIYSFMGADSSEQYSTGGCSIGGAPNSDSAADAEVNTASHEFIESETDPMLNAWYNNSATKPPGGQEIGDLCNFNPGPANSIGADVYLNGNPYILQQEWSNAVHSCAMDLNGAKSNIVPPTLTISKTGPATAVTGEVLNYSIQVTNPSNTDAATVMMVTDPLPAGVTYRPGSANIPPTTTSPLKWQLGTLAVHDSLTITFQATSNPQAFTNCASVAYDDMLRITQNISQGPACTNTTVSKAPTTTVVTSDIPTSVFGQPVTFTATVAPQPPGSGTPTGAVQFADNGNPLGSAGNLNAAFPDTYSITTSGLSVGTHLITAAYAGDSNFQASTSTALVYIVTKAPTKTTLTANPPGSVGFGHPVTFTATVSVPPPGAGSPTGPVIFSVDGTAVQTVNLNGSEQATVTTSALTPGSHLIQAAYQGDGNFLPSTDTLSYLVTCTVNITGNHPGPVLASGDSTCVTNATVGGAIVVPKGTSLAVINSTVAGSITATNAPNAIEVCGSNVGGSVDVIKAQGLVVVGDAAAVCAVNTIKGTLLLTNNTHGVEAIGNTVGGLVASGNSGPGPFPGDVTTISGNIIAH